MLFRIIYSIAILAVVASSILFYSEKDSIEDVFIQFDSTPLYTLFLIMILVNMGDYSNLKYSEEPATKSWKYKLLYLFIIIVVLVFNYIVHF